MKWELAKPFSRKPQLFITEHSSSIVAEVSKLSTESIVVAFFYCKGNIFEKRNTRYVLGSIVKQLLPHLSPRTHSEEMNTMESLLDSDVYKGRHPEGDLQRGFTSAIQRM